jgi:hypothetical protein
MVIDELKFFRVAETHNAKISSGEAVCCILMLDG